ARREGRGVIDVVGERRLDLLPARAGAYRQSLGRLPRQCRIDIDGLDLRFDRLEAAQPIRVVLGLQAERRIDAEAERPFVGERDTEVEIRNARTASGIAACAT